MTHRTRFRATTHARPTAPQSSPHHAREEPRTWCRDIEVRFCREAWQVRGEGLDQDLVFGELVDAERLAVALGRRRNCDVSIYDRNDRLSTRHATGWPRVSYGSRGH